MNVIIFQKYSKSNRIFNLPFYLLHLPDLSLLSFEFLVQLQHRHQSFHFHRTPKLRLEGQFNSLIKVLPLFMVNI